MSLNSYFYKDDKANIDFLIICFSLYIGILPDFPFFIKNPVKVLWTKSSFAGKTLQWLQVEEQTNLFLLFKGIFHISLLNCMETQNLAILKISLADFWTWP